MGALRSEGCGHQSGDAVDATETSVLRLPEEHAVWTKDVSGELRGLVPGMDHGARLKHDSIQRSSVNRRRCAKLREISALQSRRYNFP